MCECGNLSVKSLKRSTPDLLIFLEKKPQQRADYLLHDVLAFCLLADAAGSLLSTG